MRLTTSFYGMSFNSLKLLFQLFQFIASLFLALLFFSCFITLFNRFLQPVEITLLVWVYMYQNYQDFIQWGVGGSFPFKTPSFPPKKREKRRGKGERERKKKVHGGGRGACIFLRRIVNIIVSYFMTQLFKGGHGA